MGVVASVSNIPNFLVARTPKGLRRLMLETNIKFGKQFNFFDIQFVGGKWYAWYYLDITSAEQRGVQADPNGKGDS